MSERGVFAIDRGWFEHPFFASEPFTEREAWAWLISEAAWKPKKVRIGREVVSLQRGEVAHSSRFMAAKWRWSRSKVRRFIARLIKHQMVVSACSKTGPQAAHLTICNYNTYQRVSLPSGPQAAHNRPKEEDIKDIESAAAALRARASELAEQVYDIFGFDRAFIPPNWLGLGMWFEAGLRGGWKPDIVRLAVRKVAARKRGPPRDFHYLEGPIVDEHARAAAPPPPVTEIDPQRNLTLLSEIGAKHASSNHRANSPTRRFQPCDDPIVAGMARAKADRDAKRRSAGPQESLGLDATGTHDVA